MDRRQLLRNGLVAASGLAATSLFGCNSLISASKESSKTSWGYIGKKGPDNWGNLSSDFNVCQSGKNQSPINLQSFVDAELPPLRINYQTSPLRIINNGHTIQVNYQPGSILTLGDEAFELLQFHFHHPSEHKVDDKAFPMELHLVHKSEKGAFAVIGIFIKEGQVNPVLEKIWQKMPTKQGSEQTISNITINAADLLPEDKDYYRYFGSLTTPPCSETVNWIVLKEPVEMNTKQVQKFAQVFPMNARPIQNIERRFVLKSD